MGRDLVYLVWKDIKTGNKYKVAMLYKENEIYYFKYILENVKEAQKEGIELLVEFPQINATYENSHFLQCLKQDFPIKEELKLTKFQKNME